MGVREKNKHTNYSRLVVAAIKNRNRNGFAYLLKLDLEMKPKKNKPNKSEEVLVSGNWVF